MTKKIPSASPSPNTVSIISLGCPKNLVDSESMIGRLTAAGYEFQPDPSGAETVILNTCGFIASARQEAFDVLTELLIMKAAGQIGRVVVTGCLIPAVGASLREKFPDVDCWLGPFDEPRLLDKLGTLLPEPAVSNFFHQPEKKLVFHDADRLLLTLPHAAYLKIADGCDRFCSYCAIPNIRGRFVSKPLDTILDEARRLADSGVRELILIAQETTFWGGESGQKPRLAELLAKLKSRGGFEWIRVLYAYPLFWSGELIDQFGFDKATSGESPILPYIDLPLQHASDSILRAMNRRVGRSETEELLARLREKIRDLVLRTTFIVGFPGETEDDFSELLAFVKEWRFERAGVFRFSPEANTKAAALDGQVSAEISRRRFKRLTAETKKAAEAFAAAHIGKRTRVLIDEPILDEQGNPSPDFWLGRTYADSPDIDPRVFVTGERLAPGIFAEVEIVAAEGNDLIGTSAVQ